MDWHEKIAADLPAPQDDEPTSLRQDIVDELADHLRCALNREAHVAADAKQAEKNVLDRFGNPAKIARKLWLDEMWEKIMLQRATLAVTAIMAAAGVAACVMLGMVLEQNRTVNAAILQSLANVSAPAAELKSLEWNPVKVRVVRGKPGGPPLEGILVSLSGNIVGASDKRALGTVEKTTDKNGLADFGLVRPGYFTLTTASPWSETMTQQLTVRPGTEEPYEIVSPAGPQNKADVTVSIDWPDELKDKKLWIIADFAIDARQVNREYWSPPRTETLITYSSPMAMGFSGGRSLLLSPHGKQTLFPTDHMHGHPDESLEIERQRLVFSDGKSMELKESLSWPEGTVRLLALGIVQAATANGGGVAQEKLQLLDRAEYRFGGGSMAGVYGMRGGGLGAMPSETPMPSPTFTVVADKLNRWTIRLPDDLVKKVKERLAPFKESDSESAAGQGILGGAFENQPGQ